jgi:hypothetical protein
MKETKNEIFVTKLEAARRQIDAAIRMIFNNEDSVAIHTVSAAAYKILRDIKKNRDRSELGDLLSTGIYALAENLISGKIDRLPYWAEESVTLKEMIEFYQKKITENKITTYKQFDEVFRVEYHGEQKAWRTFDAPAGPIYT